MKIQLVDFKEPQFQNFTFDPLLHALLISLKKLGHEASLSIRETDPDAVNIFFAFHRVFSDNYNYSFPKKTIIFNLEPLEINSNIERFKKYIDVISENFPIIDYSYQNQNFLQNQYNFLFKFGYFDFGINYSSNINNKISFIGTLSNRRIEILNKLYEQKKINIQVFNNLWGVHRDNELIKSKATLNINKKEDGILEIYRIWHALSLGIPVISEIGIDIKLMEDWKKYVFFAPNLMNFDYKKLSNSKNLLYKETSFESEVSKLMSWIKQIY